jgi:hypothetical protein
LKYLKKYESYKELKLNLGEFIYIETKKSQKYQPTDNPNTIKMNDIYNYYTESKFIDIFINNIFIGQIIIDERYNNTISNASSTYKKSNILANLTNEVKLYLFYCHNEMKTSNPNYGTYNKHENSKEGDIPLLAHHFFDYVKKDYESNSHRSKIIKKLQENLNLQLDAEKYNL